MRLNLRLDAETERCLELLTSSGLDRSAAVRQAIVLAARLHPLIERLDRIEARLNGAVPTVPVPLDNEAAQTAGALLGFGGE